MSAVAIVMFFVVCGLLMLGYPVAFTLAGVALLFGLLGLGVGAFGVPELLDLPSRLFGVMNNETLMAVPLFVLMGVVLERARIAEDLLESMASALGRLHGGMLVAVVLVGGLMAASTGIVGATVVTLGLLSLPTLLKRGFDPSLATGTIAASGTLGQIIPRQSFWCCWATCCRRLISRRSLRKGCSPLNRCRWATCLSAPWCPACCW